MDRPIRVGDKQATAGVTIGVVADTHVPDRVRELHPGLLPGLREANVRFILHAGDICVQSVIRQLEEIAPVSAVRGNRDLFFRRSLPFVQHFILCGVPLALVHGHGSWANYLWDKWKFLTYGYQLRRYQRVLNRALPEAKVIVFGHTHQPENVWHEGKLWFNPGSASIKAANREYPSFGLLHFTADGQVTGEIINLTGASLIKRRWSIFT